MCVSVKLRLCVWCHIWVCRMWMEKVLLGEVGVGVNVSWVWDCSGYKSVWWVRVRVWGDFGLRWEVWVWDVVFCNRERLRVRVNIQSVSPCYVLGGRLFSCFESWSGERYIWASLLCPVTARGQSEYLVYSTLWVSYWEGVFCLGLSHDLWSLVCLLLIRPAFSFWPKDV